MQMMKKAVSLFLCLFWLTGTAFSVRAANTKHTYSFSVTYHQTEARSMLARLNRLRTGSDAWVLEKDNTTRKAFRNLSALQYDYELERAAMQRAAEIVARFEHERPNGEMPWGMYASAVACENIAYGYPTADEAQTVLEEADELYSGQGHRRNMLNQSITAVGLACAEYGGMKFWVQEFRNPASASAAVSPNNSLTTVSVEIMDSLIASNTASASPSSVSLQAGESAALPTVTQTLQMGVRTWMTLHCTGPVTWSSSRTSVAKISGDRIVAVGDGTATLTGRVGDGKTVSVSVRVGSEQTAYTVRFNGNGATSGSMPDQTFTDDAAQNLTANAYSRSYTVSYNYNGATGGNAVPSATANAVFNGWAVSPDGEAVCSDGENVVNLAQGGTVDLYAVWVLRGVTLPTPTRAGYIFTGWNMKPDGTGTTYAAGAYCKPAADVTLYAMWQKETAKLTSVDVRTPPDKTQYTVGEQFTQSGLTLTASYSDGSAKSVTSGLRCDGFSSEKAGTGTVTVSFTDRGVTQTTTFDVVIVPASVTLTGITVSAVPAKTTYFAGERFDPSGLTLTALYDDGSTGTVTSGFTCTGFSSVTAGAKTITVHYADQTAAFTVNVVAKAPDPIVRIQGFVASRTVDYRTSITFRAGVTNASDGADVHWMVNGKDKGRGNVFTMREAKDSFTVQAKYMQNGKVLSETKSETVEVKHGFFSRVKAFFRALFGKLPNIVQAQPDEAAGSRERL